MSEVDVELVGAARDLLQSRGDGAYHTVAAAARAQDATIVTGVNVYHFTGGPCAELVVVGRAVSEGLGRLDRIVAVGDRDRGILPPCGRCRQVLFDFFPQIEVIIADGDGARSVTIEQLLPGGYRWDQESGSTPSQT